MTPEKTLTPSPLVAKAAANAAAANALPPVPTASWEAVRKLKESNPEVDYLPYPSAPTYIVGDDGSFWSTRNRYGTRKQPKEFSSARPKRYRAIQIYFGKDRPPKVINLHVIVLETFIGPRPDGHQGAHGNGNPSDNRVSNLRWATPKDNCSDRTIHGKTQIGQKHSQAKLCDKSVMEIRRISKTNISQEKIAAEYGVCQSLISSIILGKHWKHLPV